MTPRCADCAYFYDSGEASGSCDNPAVRGEIAKLSTVPAVFALPFEIVVSKRFGCTLHKFAEQNDDA